MIRPSCSSAVQIIPSLLALCRCAKREIVVGAGRRTGSRGDAKLDDLTQRRARTNLLGRKSIDLRVAAIAQDQPLLAVENADALLDGVEGGPIVQRLRLATVAFSARSSRSMISCDLLAARARAARLDSSSARFACLIGIARN